ncbi:MAG: amidohydrolase family protein [Chloroflexi bacterium]|nr:amidohydrolase family protein [Chloroflexota bacterium]
MFDVLVIGGELIDGTGSPAVRSDLGIKGDRVTAIGDLSSSTAARIVDATGLTLSPGFIDTHCHSDGILLLDGQHAMGIRQGVTTEIITPDGIGYALVPPDKYLEFRQYHAGVLGLPPEDLDFSSVEAARKNYDRRTSCNVAMFLGHGALRINVIGMRDAPMAGTDLERAKRLLLESLEQGACGFSTGLSYYPNSWSDGEEIVDLCKVAAKFGMPFSIHTRTAYRERGFHNGGIEDALEIGRRSGVKVHIEHYRTAPHNAGQVEQIMEPIERARRDGVDVTLETYPYPTGAGSPIGALPGWFHEGKPDDMIARLADAETRAMLIKSLSDESGLGDLAGFMWTYLESAANKHLEGMAFPDAAAERGVSVEEMVCDVLLEERLIAGFRGIPTSSVRLWRQVEEDVMDLLARDDFMVGSDSCPIGGMVHPRAYGTFPRIVGRLRRRYGHPLERVIQRVTQNPAVRFGLKDRGTLEVGKFADVVVFDEKTISDQSTFEDPAVHPIGVKYVLVNGEVAVDHERCTGVLAGRAVP